MIENKTVPGYVTLSKFVIHLTRSHFKQLAIGASNSGLDQFDQVWEARDDRERRCRISFNNGWNTRFDGSWRTGRSPNVFVALYADCASTELHDYEEGSIVHAVGERLFALVVWYDRGVRNERYLASSESVSSARFDGLNLVYEATRYVVAQNRKDIRSEESKAPYYVGLSKKRTPGVAREVLHRTISEVEGLFGQGKDFFKPKKLPKTR